MTDFQTFVGSTKNYRTGVVESVALDSNGRVVVQERSAAGTLLGQTRYTPDEAAAHVARVQALLAPPPVVVDRPWAWDAASAQVDPNSPALIARFLANGCKSPNLVIGAWAVAKAVALSTDPTYTIPFTKQSGGITAQIPVGSRPAPGGDGHLAVLQVDGTVVDFWQAVYDPATGRIKGASSARRFPAGAVNYPSGWGGCASCTPLLAGLITPSDYLTWKQTGVLPDKTVQFSASNIEGPASAFRYPATHNAPTGTQNGGMVEGTRVRLAPDTDLSALSGVTRFVAELYKAKGGVCRDNGGSFGTYALCTINGQTPTWADAGLTGDSVPLTGLPVDRLQVLVPPPVS